MNRAQQAMQLFEQAVVLDPAARTTLLDRVCCEDAVLREEVEGLLRADEASGDFLEQPLSTLGDRSGEQLGPYRLQKLIGSGGMGSVYRAQRADGAFEKYVAIKLLLYDAGDLRKRFALEQRILGALSHPNIASLLDIGTDANGAPYLVMEYVEGEPITEFVNKNLLDLRTRLGYFIKILDAVQTAHRQLVVHRDIKPGNVLIDHHGEPKLLDFGIAKLIGDHAPSATRTGLAPLTPEYASPEQVRGELLGTGSDIYSLGVLLYELLTDHRPYRIDDKRPSTIERIICETEPPRLSLQLNTRRIGGSARDLDAIIFKAMAKRLDRRYASCAAFAEDLQRWLAGAEVLARNPPWSERTRRLLRRHRLAVSVVTAASVALLAGTALALWQAHIAREQAQIARNERDRAQRINHFLTDTLGAANPANLGRKATVADVLDRARRLAEKELADDPEAQSSAQLTLAESYRALGELDAAQSTGEAALKAARQHGDFSTIIDTESTLGNVYFDKSNLPLTRTMFEAANSDAQAHGTDLQRGLTAVQLGLVENEEGNPARADEWLRKALEVLPESASVERATALDSQGFAAYLRGDHEMAIRMREQAIATMQRAFPNGHPLIASFSVNLATELQRNGKFDEARSMLERVLPMQIEMLGNNSSDVLWTLAALATIEHKSDHMPAALDYAQRAYAIAQRLADDNDWKAYAYERYAEILIAADRQGEAVPILSAALAINQAMLPADHKSIASVQSALAWAQSKLTHKQVSEPMADAAYQSLLKKYGAENDYTVAAKKRLELIRALPAE